jgi:methenyltetrahydrofolate cyclohydrolase
MAQCYTPGLNGDRSILPLASGFQHEGSKQMCESSATWTIEGLGSEVANPDRFAGGGAVAAMSLVGATATAELVFQISAKRRKIEESDRKNLENAIQLCQRLRTVFRTAIDEDIASLTELMDSQSQLRQARKASEDIPGAVSRRSEEAVSAAIESPLRVARDAKRLLRTIDELQHLARPFTASDLGAAAATCAGAITSLLLMAEVNLGMVSDDEELTRIAQEIEDLYSHSEDQARNVIAQTRAVIR